MSSSKLQQTKNANYALNKTQIIQQQKTAKGRLYMVNKYCKKGLEVEE